MLIIQTIRLMIDDKTNDWWCQGSDSIHLLFILCNEMRPNWLLSFSCFPGGSAMKNPPANAGASGAKGCWVPSLVGDDPPGEEPGNPLQYSRLENPLAGYTVHRVTKSQTRLERLSRQAGHSLAQNTWWLSPKFRTEFKILSLSLLGPTLALQMHLLLHCFGPFPGHWNLPTLAPQSHLLSRTWPYNVLHQNCPFSLISTGQIQFTCHCLNDGFYNLLFQTSLFISLLHKTACIHTGIIICSVL